jgi:hypothetical protein
MTNSEHIPNGQLLPCPRCHERQGCVYANDGWFAVECDNCPHRTRNAHRSAASAIEDWNTRALTRRSSAGVKGETKTEAQPIHALPMPEYHYQVDPVASASAALTPSPTLEPTDAEVERGKISYSARDHFLAMTDQSNWGWEVGDKDRYWVGYSEAMELVQEGVMAFWPQLSSTDLPDSPDQGVNAVISATAASTSGERE